jgi:hypothetical protein
VVDVAVDVSRHKFRQFWIPIRRTDVILPRWY